MSTILNFSSIYCTLHFHLNNPQDNHYATYRRLHLPLKTVLKILYKLIKAQNKEIILLSMQLVRYCKKKIKRQ